MIGNSRRELANKNLFGPGVGMDCPRCPVEDTLQLIGLIGELFSDLVNVLKGPRLLGCGNRKLFLVPCKAFLELFLDLCAAEVPALPIEVLPFFRGAFSAGMGEEEVTQ